MIMKKFFIASFFLLALASCTGNTNVDKVDETGYNPAPEQIVGAANGSLPVVVESQDSISNIE